MKTCNKRGKMKNIKRFIFVLMFGFSFISINALSAQNVSQKIDSLMNLYHNNNEFHGTVLVAKKGNIIYQKGFGYANIEWGIPNKVNTKYRIASISKQFTAMLVLQMVEKGLLELNTPIIKYLPEYPKKNGKIITIHHLLSHTSGIPHYSAIPGFFDKESRLKFSHKDFIKLFWKKKLLFEPGKKHKYSSFGYYLLGYILERISKKSYSQLLKDKIFIPAGMKNSHVEDHKTILSNRASGYNYSVIGFLNADYRDFSTALATGDIITTAYDLFKWDKALSKNNLLSSKIQKLLFKPNINNYGYGWNIKKEVLKSKKKITIISHSGSIRGFESQISRITEDDFLIIILCNVEYTDRNAINKNIIDILYNRPYKYKKSITESLKKLIKTDGLDKALKQYKIWKNKNKNEYDFGMRGLLFLGYQYSEEKKYVEAIKVFKLLTEEFPKSSGAYEYQADAYLKNGNKKLAIQNYAKVLQLNPSNTSVIKKLADIYKK